MVKIEFIKVRGQNFRSWRDRTIVFGKKKTVISGRNEVGKSTTNDLVSWILFNKLANGNKADKIRPHDINNVDIDDIDITGELDVEVDGKIINIVKIQSQIWSHPKAQTERRFDGNTNKYIVNTIPKTETEFKKYFAEIIDVDTFASASNATNFLNKTTNDRRIKMLELAPGITNEYVIGLDPRFEPVGVELKNNTIEELIGRCKFALNGSTKNDTGLKGELDGIPLGIKAVDKLRVVIDVAEMELKKNALQEQISDIDKQLNDTEESVKAVDKLSGEIMQTQFAISDVKRKANEELFANRKAIQKQIDDITETQNTVIRKRNALNSSIEDLEQSIAANDKILSSVKVDYEVESKKVFDESTCIFDESKWVFSDSDTVCNQCGQTLPIDEIATRKADFASRKAKTIDDFEAKKNSDKVEFETKKEKIVKALADKGNTAFTTIKADKVSLDKLKADFEVVKAEIITLNGQHNELDKQLEALPTEIDLSDNKEIAELKVKLESLNNQYDSMRDTETHKKALEQQKSALQDELSATQKTIDSADNSKIDEAIEAYRVRQKELVQLICNVERELLLYKDFQKMKMTLLTDEVNKFFTIIKWKLFEDNISGDGYKDICEPTYKGTEYSKGLNDGGKIAIELDIVNTLQKIYEVSVPVFLDRAESIDEENIPEIDAQVIILQRASIEGMKVEVE